MRFAHDERADLAKLLAELSPQQWEKPTLCERWSVHEVVAHLVSYEELSMAQVVAHMVKARIRSEDVNDAGVREYSRRSPQELLAFLNEHLDPRGLTAKFGGRIGLTDCMIHHQDIRHALDLPRTIPAQRLVPALDFARTAPPLGARQRTRGLRFVATDVDWSAGSGPEINGPGESLLLAIAGRRVGLAELSGDGLSLLDSRVPA